MKFSSPVFSLGLLASSVGAIQVNFDSDESIKAAASTVAFGLARFYTGNNTGDTPGNLPDPYFWWEAGAMFGTLVDYWFHTGDDSYNAMTTQALLHQVGDDRDYMPTNQTRTLGNDDQGFWAMAAMSAAENNFPNPPPDQPQWLALAQAVFNEYVDRWDEEHCDGGLRWQIFQFNAGFEYKNTISNGCFFNIASRLARYTGNQTYADWAGKVWTWLEGHELIDSEYNVFDGAGIVDECATHDKAQWTYNAGIYLHGAAALYDYTNGSAKATWQTRIEGLISRTREHFFDKDTGILVERACETFGNCNNDQQSFRGYLMRWFGAAMQLAPFTYDTLMPILRTNAAAAARQCTGSPPASQYRGPPGTACGFTWTGSFDGLVGVGPQMSALSALQYTLIKKADTAVPATALTGGTSVGDVNAGARDEEKLVTFDPITMGERVAAGFATSAIALSLIAAVVFMMRDETEIEVRMEKLEGEKVVKWGV
ncbi:glycoside hydrolase family 76 protein [Microdochium trichocladiopsis]|uniref:Mannan endo-1,6-alpha-mannosidase n=1 Tax=Microdochium trichocladiopsis TaxID=1682393 RepID=A0A9P9BRU4_9PEZI|nr:glycoside hydrolase family 76 protein [Microdochium trichocladiopsis]KAH7033088.1 glycoside hydrolase family 76 protein [Microdochium trichocladiopsis]